MVFVSMSLRLKVDVDAMNMVEPMGAYTRHRMVPIVRKRGTGRYSIVMAPAISGQSLAFAYQATLVELAKRRGLPVCDACANYRVIGGFIKQNGDIESCVVEDITGFMLTSERGQLAKRRTSAIWFSYMIPDLEGASAHIEPQMHVRYNYLQPSMQQLFEIEVASAVYTVSIVIDPERIGVEEHGEIKNGKYVSVRTEVKERKERIELAFDALKVMFEGQMYGAKKSRVLATVSILGAIAAVSDPLPFMVSPARVRTKDDHYINETLRRARIYTESLDNETIDLIYMDKEGLKIDDSVLKQKPETLTVLNSTSTFAELIDVVKNRVIEKMGLKQ